MGDLDSFICQVIGPAKGHQISGFSGVNVLEHIITRYIFELASTKIPINQ